MPLSSPPKHHHTITTPPPHPHTPQQLDRHKFVKIAHHGFRRLPSPERDAIYNTGAAARDEYGGAGYAMVDTLFSLAESFLFCQLVEMAVRSIWDEMR